MTVFDTLQYKALSPAAQAQVRLDWSHAYAELMATIRKLKLEYKQAQRDKQPVCVLVLRLHTAKINATTLIATRHAIKKTSGELRTVSVPAKSQTPTRLRHVPHLSDARVLELCRDFDIAVYQVGKVYAHILPEADNQKWFVSALVDDFRISADVCKIPLTLSEMEANRAAVHFLRLEHIVQEDRRQAA